MTRKTSYKKEYAGQAAVACRLGAKDLDLAEMFGVTWRTIQNWKINFPDFNKALTVNKDSADSHVEKSLYQRACGYQVQETEIKVVNGEIIPVDVIKHYPPDPTSMIFWLKNRKPKQWRDRVEQEKESSSEDKLLDAVSNLIEKLPS